MVAESDRKKGVFIKFGELEHLRQLQAGLLYCNSLDYFAQLENTHAAADAYENVTYLKDFSGGKISFWPAEERKPKNPLTLPTDWCQFTTRKERLGNIAANKESLGCRLGFVKYVDLKYYNGKKGIFQKDIRFLHEQEWRVYFAASASSAIRMDIGSIYAISTLCRADLKESQIFLQGDNSIGISCCEIIKTPKSECAYNFETFTKHATIADTNPDHLLI